jgi:hypothetical protein
MTFLPSLKPSETIEEKAPAMTRTADDMGLPPDGAAERLRHPAPEDSKAVDWAREAEAQQEEIARLRKRCQQAEALLHRIADDARRHANTYGVLPPEPEQN